MRRILIAGVGNIFLGDDGFGVEVAMRLSEQPLPDGVQVADYGIRAVHLAYELLSGYDGLILVDAVARGDAPGTVYVIEPDLDTATTANATMDAHSMSPDTVFALMNALGVRLGEVYVVGCEPDDVSERMGLSGVVDEAVDHAVTAVLDIAAKMTGQIEDAVADPPSRARNRQDVS